MKEFFVFYSWQSDLPETRKFIQRALTHAANNVMAELPDVSITIDQATRGLTGSPNIPMAIINKIKESDMVVSDITPINAGQQQKKTPNPNVLFELGFAVATQGWDRVALVFDEGVGTFPADVPFDFDKHRAIPFTCSNNGLAGILKTAIKSTLEANPARPTATLTPEQIKHKRDVDTLRRLFKHIDIQTVDDHIMRMPHCVTDQALHMWDMFNIAASGNDVHLNDAELLELIRQFRMAFGQTMAHTGRYHEAGKGLYHIFTGHDTLSTPGGRKAWDEIDAARLKMHEVFKELLSHMRRQFLEVDLQETSMEARKDYRDYRMSLAD